MEESSRDEMDISNENPGINITSSWVLLDTEEATQPTVSEEVQDEIESGTTKCIAKEQEQAIPSNPFEDIIQNMSDCSYTKSDTESDGISIISESEFYNGRSDEDGSINSNDENTTDSFQTLELSIIQPDEPSALHNPKDVKEVLNFTSEDNEDCRSEEKIRSDGDVSNFSFVFRDKDAPSTSENDDMAPRDFSKEANDSTNKLSKKPIAHKHKDEKFHRSLIMIYLKLNVIYIALTLLEYFIFNNQDSALGKENLDLDGQDLARTNKMENLTIYEYCLDIYESSNFNEDYITEKCVKKFIKRMKKIKNLKQEHRNSVAGNVKSNDHHSNRFNTNNIFKETHESKRVKYKEKKFKKKYEHYSNKKFDKRSNNTNLKMGKENEVLQETYNHSTRKSQHNDKAKKLYQEKLMMEREKLNNWRRNLAKKEERLEEWETELVDRERQVFQEKKSDSLYGACEFKRKDDSYYKKIKLDRYQNMGRFRKKYESESSQEKKIKEFKNKDVQSKFQNENNRPSKGRSQIRLNKMKTIEVGHSQRKNKTSILDDYNTISGEWYSNLIGGRTEIRRNNEKARWWFDRVNFRKIKRNKAHWYFQYMYSREDWRYHPTNC